MESHWTRSFDGWGCVGGAANAASPDRARVRKYASLYTTIGVHRTGTRSQRTNRHIGSTSPRALSLAPPTTYPGIIYCCWRYASRCGAPGGNNNAARCTGPRVTIQRHQHQHQHQLRAPSREKRLCCFTLSLHYACTVASPDAMGFIHEYSVSSCS